MGEICKFHSFYKSYFQLFANYSHTIQKMLQCIYQVAYLLPEKPSEIAIDNGISRRIGGVLGIVFN